jgi:hypothetical protein
MGLPKEGSSAKLNIRNSIELLYSIEHLNLDFPPVHNLKQPLDHSRGCFDCTLSASKTHARRGELCKICRRRNEKRLLFGYQSSGHTQTQADTHSL